MTFDFTDFEMPLLQALFKLGGKARTKDVCPEVEKIMGLTPAKFPEEYETYQKGQIKWKNKTAWASGAVFRMLYSAEETVREHGTVAGLSLNLSHPVLKLISIIQVNVILLFVGSMIGLIVRLRYYASRTSLININRMREVDHEQKGITYQRD